VAGRVYETAIKLAAKVASSFRPEVLGAAKAVERLRGETDKLRAGEKAAEGYARTAARLAEAKQKYDTAAEAVRRLADAEKAAGGATKESAKWRAAGERELAKASKNLDRASLAAGHNAAALHAAGVKTKDVAAAQKILAERLQAVETRIKRADLAEKHFSETLEKARKSAARFTTVEGSAGKVGSATKSLFSDAMKIVGAATVAGGALGALVLRTIRVGDEIGDTADKIGIGTTALQELRFAARQSGAEAEELDTALRKLGVNIGKAMAARKKGGGFSGEVGGIQMLPTAGGGTAGVNDPFARVGLSAAKLAKLKPDEQLLKIADAMQKLKTHDEQAAFVTAALGKSATALIPMLADGADGLKRLQALSHKYGGILTPEQLAAADQADRAMKQAQLAAEGLAGTLGGTLAPVATKAFQVMAQWAADNQGKIKAWAQTAATWIEQKAIPAIQKLVPQVIELGKRLGVWIDKGVTLIGGVQNLGVALAALRLAPTGFSMAALGVNVARLAVQYWGAATAAKALAAAQKEGGGGGGAAAAAGGVGAAARAALSASTLTGAIAAGGVAITAGLVAAAAGIGIAIGTGIREIFNTDDAIARALGQNVRGDSAGDSNDEDRLETDRLNNFARVAAAKRRQRDAQRAATPLPEPQASGGAVHHHFSPRINVTGGASEEDADRVRKAVAEEHKKHVKEQERRRANERRLAYG
jgi:hypothetical protein